MKRPGKNRATLTGVKDSLPQSAVCGDCSAILSDWILDLDGTCLCFACADVWEDYHPGEGSGLSG
jgi:hypothetical protein